MLSAEELFNEPYEALSLIIPATWILMSQKMPFLSRYRSDWEDVNSTSLKQQKKTSVIGTESANENHGTWDSSLSSAEEGVKLNISWRLEKLTGVLPVPAECHNPQTVSDITDFILGQPPLLNPPQK